MGDVRQNVWYRTSPLEWKSMAKAEMLLILTLLMHCAYTGWAHYVIGLGAVAEVEQAVRVDYLVAQLPFFHAMLVLSFLLVLAIPLAWFKWGNRSLYEYVAANYYGLSHCYFAWLIGTLALPTGIILAGAPVLGFIFFHRGAVMSAFISASLMLIVLAVLSVRGDLIYAPLVKQFVRDDGSASLFWTASYILYIIPHILFLLGLAYLLLRQWREREDEVRVMSTTDPLTGLLNRRSIHTHFRREQGRSAQQGLPMAVIMLDLDHFKQINDTWGHEAGDRVLVAVAEAMLKSVRQNDRVGRHGGEEFLLVLPGVDSNAAQRLAERFRQQIEALKVMLSDGRVLNVTASMGLYCNEKDRQASMDTMLRRADKALYTAKQAGRNRVVVADEDTDLP